jgi:hypothetical protein
MTWTHINADGDIELSRCEVAVFVSHEAALEAHRVLVNGLQEQDRHAGRVAVLPSVYHRVL